MHVDEASENGIGAHSIFVLLQCPIYIFGTVIREFEGIISEVLGDLWHKMQVNA